MRSGYTCYNFSVVDVHLNQKVLSAKNQLLNMFKDHHAEPKLGSTPVEYNGWSLSTALRIKFYNGHYIKV